MPQDLVSSSPRQEPCKWQIAVGPSPILWSYSLPNHTRPDQLEKDLSHMSNVVFHIGFPKTATTTLQSVLMETPSCHYIGKGLRETMQPSPSLDMARAVLFADTQRFEEMLPKLQDHIKAPNAACVMVSDEAFSFAEHMKIGQHWGRQVITDHHVIAGRLAQICPDARVMISVRDQMAFLKSFFRQAIKKDGFQGSFNDYISIEIEALPYRSMLHLLRYDEVYDTYVENFGAENLMVSVYESYQDDFGSYLDATAGFCGLDASELRDLWGGRHANKAKTHRASSTQKRLRQIIPASLRQLAPGSMKRAINEALAKPPEPAEFTQVQEDTLTMYFSNSNAGFAQKSGLDIAGFGYP